LYHPLKGRLQRQFLENIVGGGKTMANMKWIGSKNEIAPWIIDHFCAHERFIDVFGGSGAILMKKEPSTEEIYNDLDGRWSNFFRVISNKRLHNALIEMSRYVMHDRRLYEECQKPQKTTPLKRAFSHIYLQSVSWCGRSGGFCTAGIANGLATIPQMIERYYQRFRHVVIENLDYRVLVKRYAHKRRHTLAYYDEPYLTERTRKDYYAHNWHTPDHVAFLEFLQKQEYPCIVSGSDTVLYRTALKTWRFDARNVTYSSTHRKKTAKECLWWNYNNKGQLL
jgi:DNA adenine methylase